MAKIIEGDEFKRRQAAADLRRHVEQRQTQALREKMEQLSKIMMSDDFSRAVSADPSTLELRGKLARFDRKNEAKVLFTMAMTNFDEMDKAQQVKLIEFLQEVQLWP